MKATEFRRGNLINPNCGELEHIGEIVCLLHHKVEVELIDENYEEYLSSHQSCKYENISGIPLTEEWLLKFGFEWSIYHQAWHKQGFVFDLSDRHAGGFFMHKSRLNSDIIQPEILYVHSLQNLYFALTGNELVKQ